MKFKEANLPLGFCNPHRFLLPQKSGKDGDMDTCREDVNLEDDRSNFLSRGQIHTLEKLEPSDQFNQNTWFTFYKKKER